MVDIPWNQTKPDLVLSKETQRTKDKKKNRDQPDHSTVENS